MSSGDEHKKTPLKSNSNKETESTMLLLATLSSSNENDSIGCGDNATVTALNNDPVKDSKRISNNAADLLSTDIAPNTTAVQIQNTDETTSLQPIEGTTTVNNEFATTAAGSDGNNETALTFPQRVSRTH